MDVEQTKTTVVIRLKRDLNFLTGRRLAEIAAAEKSVTIDLSQSRFVDSEGIKVLYRLLRAGKVVTLVNPPQIYFEVVRILSLNECFEDVHIRNLDS